MDGEVTGMDGEVTGMDGKVAYVEFLSSINYANTCY